MNIFLTNIRCIVLNHLLNKKLIGMSDNQTMCTFCKCEVTTDTKVYQPYFRVYCCVNCSEKIIRFHTTLNRVSNGTKQQSECFCVCNDCNNVTSKDSSYCIDHAYLLTSQ